MAVAVLWYPVGYFREQRNTQKNPAVSIAILLWGMILMCLCIVLMREAFLWSFFFPVRFVNALLYAWTEEMHGSD